LVEAVDIEDLVEELLEDLEVNVSVQIVDTKRLIN
jgi:hypothetical protein